MALESLFSLNFWTQLNFAELGFSFLSVLLVVEDEKYDKRSAGPHSEPYFLRLRLWSSQPKTHTDRQWEDSAVTLHPSWAPSGSTEALLQSLHRQHLDHWTQPRGGGGVYLCALARMNQPLSAEPRPLTYWACSSKTWRSTLTLFPIFQ